MDRETGDESATPCVIMYLPFENRIIYRTLYFVKAVLSKLMLYTLISHTDAHTVRGRPHYDVERFRNGSVHEFYSLEAGQES